MLNKKEKIFIISFFTIIILAIIIPVSIHVYNIYKIKNPYIQEYVAGSGNIKGDVCVECFEEVSPILAIGADKDGYAVFKNPRKAFAYVKKNYKKGINFIKKANNLGSFNQFNYNMYSLYGAQSRSENYEENQEARFVSLFLDIYENSFD